MQQEQRPTIPARDSVEEQMLEHVRYGRMTIGEAALSVEKMRSMKKANLSQWVGELV